MNMLLEAQGLAASVPGRTLFDALDLTVRAGECWAIVGPNGAGKTTLLRVLAGLVAPSAGRVCYAGQDAASMAPRERALPRGAAADRATPWRHGPETALIGRHPHLGRFAWEGGADVERAFEALAKFGLEQLAQRDVRTLSGGERRRVALAALLVQDTPFALLDEPSSHLDIAQQAAALEVFVGLARERGRSLVMVLHDLHLAARFCDHAIAVGGGRARADRAAEVLNAPALSALFGRAGRTRRRRIVRCSASDCASVRSQRRVRRRLRRNAVPGGAGGPRPRPAASSRAPPERPAPPVPSHAGRVAASVPAMIVSATRGEHRLDGHLRRGYRQRLEDVVARRRRESPG
jgi:iron complex transport system ATP-binding protein